MNRRGYTLIELLVPIVVLTVAIVIGNSVASRFGTWAGIASAVFAGLLIVVGLVLLDRRKQRRTERRLLELKQAYRAIYRVVAVSPDLKIVTLPEGAEIKIGDYGWEAGPVRSDGLIYLQGLTKEWTVVWHAGFHPDQIEWVATKPHSQYEFWHPYWAVPPPPPPCPFPVIERETLTMGLPHHSHSYFVCPTPYPSRESPGPIVKNDQ